MSPEIRYPRDDEVVRNFLANTSVPGKPNHIGNLQPVDERQNIQSRSFNDYLRTHGTIALNPTTPADRSRCERNDRLIQEEINTTEDLEVGKLWKNVLEGCFRAWRASGFFDIVYKEYCMRMTLAAFVFFVTWREQGDV
ncbi:uncharacterized protein BP5553_02629 [Venustampulla echinocandica]|uniref:Uncharacterized protein n=1 Tax=Venustampulla echinocandica TaxID=2656787 RepID=A0A370TRX4_9HELO|nr:uncharacterized protein BP5553_02629 [Venustampulla echinocandica]RDL38289.1 hypothetical protein BP5553_02629 [Venustampulla echinocandica]